MAPTAALALNGSGAAADAGRAVPLVFLLAAIGVGFVSYAFIRLSRYISHAGSMYGFAGVALGPRPALGVGWTLFGTYVMLAATGCAGAAVFVLNLFSDLNILSGVGWIPIVIIVYLLAAAVGYAQINRATRVLLVAEGISITLVTILIVIIFVKLFAGSAPGGLRFFLAQAVQPGSRDLDVGTVPRDRVRVPLVRRLRGCGDTRRGDTRSEAQHRPRDRRHVDNRGDPVRRRDAGRDARLRDRQGRRQRVRDSSAPLGDLAHSYVGPWYRDLVDLGATLSMFAACLGATTAAARMLYVLAGNGLGPTSLAKASDKTGSPLTSVIVCVAFGLLALLYMGVQGATATDAFFYPATLGTLGLLVAYIVTNVSAFKFMILERRAPAWEAVFPIAGTIFLGYVLWKQVYPVPDHPYNLFPYIDLAFVIIGCAYLMTRRGIVERTRTDVDALRADAHAASAGPFISAGEVEVPASASEAEKANARVL